MNMVALLMRPWIQMMIDNNIEPRTMADDLFFFTKGKDHVEVAKKGMNLSLSFFQDIEAKVAQNKCFMTSTDHKARENLRTNLFGEEGKCIQVLNHFRDLGSHACMDNTKTAKTLNERVEKGHRKGQKAQMAQDLYG